MVLSFNLVLISKLLKIAFRSLFHCFVKVLLKDISSPQVFKKDHSFLKEIPLLEYLMFMKIVKFDQNYYLLEKLSYCIQKDNLNFNIENNISKSLPPFLRIFERIPLK